MPWGPKIESAGKFFDEVRCTGLGIEVFHVGVGNSDFCGKPLKSCQSRRNHRELVLQNKGYSPSVIGSEWFPQGMSKKH